MDRKDLALKLRLKFGDWEKVLSLCEQGIGDDELLLTSQKNIGE